MKRGGAIPVSIELPCGGRLSGAWFGAAEGRVVLYHHGFPGSHCEASLAAEAATQLGLRLLAFDRPGIGDSTRDPLFTPERWCQAIAAALTQLGIDRFSVFGLSGGGPYAAAVAAAFPKRVDRLLLVSAMAPLDKSSDLSSMVWVNRMMLRGAMLLPAVGLLPVGVIGVLWKLFPQFSRAWYHHFVDPVDREILTRREVAAVMGANVRATLRQGVRPVMRELENLVSPWGVGFGEVQCPVDIWHGTGDHYVPLNFARILGQKVPHAELYEVEGGGHFMVVDRAGDILGKV